MTKNKEIITLLTRQLEEMNKNPFEGLRENGVLIISKKEMAEVRMIGRDRERRFYREWKEENPTKTTREYILERNERIRKGNEEYEKERERGVRAIRAKRERLKAQLRKALNGEDVEVKT